MDTAPMEGPIENWIYPSAFTPCLLRCVKRGASNATFLYMEQSMDTIVPKLAFTEKMYEDSGSLLRCDYVVPKEHGLPFLIITDVLKIGGKDFSKQPYPVRIELARKVLEDRIFFDMDSLVNEYRIRFPTRFDISQIDEVFSFILPNHYGVVKGVRFTKDSLGKPHGMKLEEGEEALENGGIHTFTLIRTKLPEVYELYSDDMTPVAGNNVLYIPNLKVAKDVKNRLAGKNSIRVECKFDECRHKWGLADPS